MSLRRVLVADLGELAEEVRRVLDERLGTVYIYSTPGIAEAPRDVCLEYYPVEDGWYALSSKSSQEGGWGDRAAGRPRLIVCEDHLLVFVQGYSSLVGQQVVYPFVVVRPRGSKTHAIEEIHIASDLLAPEAIP